MEGFSDSGGIYSRTRSHTSQDMPEGFCDSDGIYTPSGMPAGGRDLIKPEYIELCLKRGRRYNIANNTPYIQHSYYNLTVRSLANTKPPNVIFSYWTCSEKKAIDQCIESFDKRLRLDEECRAKQVERAKKCPPKQSNKRAKRPRKQSD